MKKIEKTSLLFGAIAIAAACSSGAEDADTSDNDDADVATGASTNSGGDAATNTGGSTTSGGNTSSGGASSGGSSENTGGATSSGGMGGMGGDGLPSDVSFTFDPTKDKEPDVCAAKQLEGTQIPLDMFIILDQSGSMASGAVIQPPAPACGIGPATVLEGSRWCNAITALDGFFKDPSSVGMGIAYSEFESTGCEAFAGMDVPFNVIEAGDANGHLGALFTALSDDGPRNNTFTEGAVLTLIDQTTSHVPTGSRRAVTVLVTDGSPTGCLTGAADAEMVELNALLKAHYQDKDIPNFIIGMDGAAGDLLESLAVDAGALLHTDNCLPGHSECSYYSVGDGDPAVFIQALEAIRGQAVGCEYTVPKADVGVSVLDSLTVKYKQDIASDAEVLQRVGSEADCVADVQYWVDTSGADEAIVKLCQNTCDRRGPETTVEMELACEGT